jgi:hypothetical protein
MARLLDDVRAGESRALVLRGEAGAGKTALLEYLVEHASRFQVLRATGVHRRWSWPSPGYISC